MKVINYKEVEVGDIIIVPNLRQLRYGIVRKIPLMHSDSSNSYYIKLTRFDEMLEKTGIYSWAAEKLELDCTLHNSVVRVDIKYKDIILVQKLDR